MLATMVRKTTVLLLTGSILLYGQTVDELSKIRELLLRGGVQSKALSRYVLRQTVHIEVDQNGYVPPALLRMPKGIVWTRPFSRVVTVRGVPLAAWPEILRDSHVRSVELVREPAVPLVIADTSGPHLLAFGAPGRPDEKHGLDKVWPDAKGDGVTCAVVDQGAVDNRPAFSGRLTVVPPAPAVKTHSTAMAGLIGAANPAFGMAPKVKLLSYSWDRPLREVAAAAASVSNHSYTNRAGWTEDGVRRWHGDMACPDEDTMFGFYGLEQKAVDEISFEHPLHLFVAAAGNSRLVGPDTPEDHFHGMGSTTLQHDKHPPNGSKDERVVSTAGTAPPANATGFDTVRGLCVAKNVLCVGAIRPNGNRTHDSAFGPTDDGRIKPDLVALGAEVCSVSPTASDKCESAGFTTKSSPTSATSQATAVVSGAASALVELFRKKLNREPLSSDLRAVLIHTADERDVAGPDPMNGWGILNAAAAADVIRKPASFLTSTPISTGQTFSWKLTGIGGPLRATLAWTDPAATPHQPSSGCLENTSTRLVNDLDISIVDFTNASASPKLPYLIPIGKAIAERGVNDRDNIERIDIDSGTGTWILKVRGTRIGAGPQAFSLIVTGATAQPIP